MDYPCAKFGERRMIAILTRLPSTRVKTKKEKKETAYTQSLSRMGVGVGRIRDTRRQSIKPAHMLTHTHT